MNETDSGARNSSAGWKTSWKVSWRIVLPGILLFLFIPVVLYLYLQHPEPMGRSLILGLVLMIGHRFIARPYMFFAHDKKCLWSNKTLGPGEGVEVEIHHRGGIQKARCLERNRWHLERFFTHAYRRRWILAPGIFAPLLLLLVSLVMAALGKTPPIPLDTVKAIFQLVIGCAVNFAAWGYFAIGKADEPLQIRFPVHNFFLLGIANLLWIFRLMGTWWIYKGARFLLGL